MRVAVNAWFLNSPTTGSGQYLRSLSAAIASLNTDVELVMVEPRARGKLAKVWFEQVEFPLAVRRMKADLAWVPYWAGPLACAIPVVCTIHDVIPLALPAYRGGIPGAAYLSLVRASAPGAAHILTDSEFSRQDIVKHLGIPEDRVTAVLLAADARFSPGPPAEDTDRVRARYNLPETYALYLGGFDPRKNIETLFQVYVWAGETIGTDFPLVVTGRPEDRCYAADGAATTLGEMAKALEVEDVVRLVGRVDEDDKPALYAGARAFVYPSTYEGFGLPPLEAMACGVPVIGSNAACIPEVVGGAGMLVDPLDARRMAGALIAVCAEDDLHARLAQKALLRASEFSWSRAAIDTLGVFRRTMRAG